MKKICQKAFIVKNYSNGWKVVLDGKHVDCTKPVYDSCDTTEIGLSLCRKYCTENDVLVIRECQ